MQSKRVERPGTQQQHADDREDSRWNGIGIHAVAAASIYADHGEKRQTPRARLSPLVRDEGDLATD